MWYCLLGFLLLGAMGMGAAPVPEKRSSYSIKLSRIQVAFNEQTNRFAYVRIINADRLESYVQIGPLTDYQLRAGGDVREKTEYREDPSNNTAISDFEAEQVNAVCRTFSATLNDFENDLRARRWDRLSYLDAYLPRFLRGFYYLYTAVRASPKSLPRSARVDDSWFDVSESSPKTDARIVYWREHDNVQIKLRMAAKELDFQMREWQKKELAVNRRNPDQQYGSGFEKAFSLFIRVYFENSGNPGNEDEDGEE